MRTEITIDDSAVYRELEDIKHRAWSNYHNKKQSVDGRAQAIIDLCFSWWERDLGQGRYTSNYLPFNDFIAMYNLEKAFSDAEAVNRVREQFGKLIVPRKLRRLPHRFGGK